MHSFPVGLLSINLLVILVGVGMLHMWGWVSGGVYRNWCVDTPVMVVETIVRETEAMMVCKIFA